MAKVGCGRLPLTVLSVCGEMATELWPTTWRMVRADDFLDTDALREDFLTFLDRWPRQPLDQGKTFDDLFRRPGGYSVWWTGPGIARHPDRSDVYLQLRTLWLVDRAIRRLSPRQVLVFTPCADLAWSLASRCRRRLGD